MADKKIIPFPEWTDQFEISLERKRKLVPKNKLLKGLDALFVPSSFYRNVRAGIINEKRDTSFLDLETGPSYLAASLLEISRLAIYGGIVYSIFK
jgi:hypothetical protein